MANRTMPPTVLNHLGLTVAVLEAAGADPYDLEPSKPNFP
jgi:hypothetical protein